MKVLEQLERKLSYEDIRFYRSIARSRLRKDLASKKQLEIGKAKDEKPKPQGWGSWLWGSSGKEVKEDDPAFGGPMTEQQRKELYDALDYDEKSALADAFQAPRDAMKARVVAKLNKGSFALKADPHGEAREIISVVFDVFQANIIQRTDNLEAAISLGDFGVFDGTTKDTLYPKIVQVKKVLGAATEAGTVDTVDEPFFYVNFEHNPLDDRADNALTLRMRHMEIIYHKGYVEAVYAFFKPPASQLESVEALLVSTLSTQFCLDAHAMSRC